MKRATVKLALLVALPLSIALSVPLHAAKIPVSGTVLDRDGAAVSGARVVLSPFPALAAGGELEMAGKVDPEPVATAVSDASGAFRLEAPDAGMWKVRIEATGYAPLFMTLAPLVEEMELPEARLLRDTGFKATVVDPQGKPVAGARVRIEDDRRPVSGPLNPWVVPAALAVTGPDGTASLPRAEGEPLRVRAGAAGFPIADLKGVRTGAASLRLAPGFSRRLQVKDEKGKGIAGAVVWIDGWAAGRTAEGGTLDLVLPGRNGLQLLFAAADGRQLFYRLKDAPPEGETPPAAVTLPALVAVAGRIVSNDGRPVAGAVAWSAAEVGRAVRTGADGGFRLAVPAGPDGLLAAAAAGYFSGQAELRGRNSVTLPLAPKTGAAGLVVDEAGKGVTGAVVSATPRPGVSRDRSVYQSGGSARSGAGGRFRLASLAPGVPYSLRVRHPGYAPAEAELPSREAGAPAPPDLRIVLKAGRQVVGAVIDGDRAPVAGARIVLEPSAPPGRMPFLREPAAPRAPVTTDARGRFSVGHLAAGSYDLKVAAKGFAPLTVPGLAVSEGKGDADLGTVQLARGAAVEGKVVDPAGRPVEGAEVRASAGAGRVTSIRFPWREDSPADAVTAADGSFRLEDRSPGETLDLAVRRDGFGPGSAPGVAVPTEEPLRIVLQPAVRVSGRALGKDGKGIAGAQVTLVEKVAASFLGRSRLAPSAFRNTVADDDGRFSFDSVSPGSVDLSASAPRHQTAELDGVEVKPGADLGGLELVLPTAGLIEGRVLGPDGRPVPHAEVEVVESESGPSARPSFDSRETDGEGRYTLDGVALGPRTLEARADGYRRGVRDLEVKEGSNVADFTLERGPEVSGRVVDDAGAPISAARVILSSGPGGEFLTATSGADGSFRIAGVQDGTFRLLANKEGYASSKSETVTVAGSSVGGVEIQLTAGGAVVGRLSGLDFSQLSRVVVAAERRPGQVDADGNYRIQNLPPGHWRVTATVPDTSLRAEGEVTLDAGSSEARLDLQLGKGITLSGVVLRNGAPLPGAGLSLVHPGAHDAVSASSDHQGGFRFGGLEPGSYVLTVRTAAGGYHREPVELSSDREIQVELQGAVLAGRVVDAADRTPVAGAEIVLDSAGDDLGGHPTALTDAHGAFRLADVNAGSWMLRASHDGYAPAQRPVELGGDAPADDVEVALSPTEGVTLEVVLPSGGAPERVRAGVLDGVGNVVTSGFYPVGENGRVRLRDVPPGSWQVLVDGLSGAPATVAVQAPGPVQRVVLPPSGTVRVEVPDLAQGTTAAVVTLSGPGGLYRAFDFDRLLSQWDAYQGRTNLGRVPAGTWQVTVKAADGRTWTGTAAVAPGQVAQVTLK